MSESMSSVFEKPGRSSLSSDQAQDNLWIASSKKGDTLAFNRLVLKWEATVYNVALRMLQDRDEAAEATQEVFLLAFKNIQGFRQDSKFSTWLYRITLNHCVSRLKQRPPGTHISLDDENAARSVLWEMQIPHGQVGELIRSEQRNKLLSALSHLPPDQRVIVELKFFQEMTFEDIAAVLEIPLSTIKSRLYAGLETLKIRMSNKA